MAKFELVFETYVQCQTRVEVEAGSLSEAIAMSAGLTPDLEDFEPDFGVMTEPRLYSIGGELGTLTRVRLPDCRVEDTWTGVDLRAQWPRGLDAPLTDAESRAFDEASAALAGSLAPILEDRGERLLRLYGHGGRLEDPIALEEIPRAITTLLGSLGGGLEERVGAN